MRIKIHLENSGQVGLELKIARIRKGLKQWEIARRAGICQNALSLIETGRKQPTLELIDRIQKALDEK